MLRISRRTLLAGLGGYAVLQPLSLFLRQAIASNADPHSSLAEQLASYAETLQPTDLNPQTIQDAKCKFIDAIGCAIAAINEAPVRAIREIAFDTPSNAATILGTGRKTTMELAAFANGAAVRYFDYNDAYTGKETGHPSDTISGVLAVGETMHKTGRDVVLAIVLAYEIDCHLLDTVQLSAKGWDHPNFILPAEALAVGKLMGLSRGQLTQAVNLSLSGHLAMNQTRSEVISNWKGLAAAEAVRAGVFAAQLARAGITGPEPIFEGSAGFFKLVSGELQLDVTQFAKKQGHFKVSDCTTKFYPAQTQTLTAVAAAAKISRQIVDTSQIASIAITTTRAGMDYTANERAKWAPTSRETADHSMPFIVSRTLLDGTITPHSFDASRLQDENLKRLMAVVTVVEDPAFTALYPEKVPNRVTVTLYDGRAFSERVDTVAGFKSTPMLRADIEDKFHRNAHLALSERQQRHFLDLAWTLDTQTDLRRVIMALQPLKTQEPST